MVIKIKRVSYAIGATYGAIMYDDIPFALTLEDPWKDNQVMVSCIPEGEYLCKRVDSPKFGDTFEVTNVPGRTHILFHKGNTHEDTHGCILVGEQFGRVYGMDGILSSKAGYGEFMDLTSEVDEFNLEIYS